MIVEDQPAWAPHLRSRSRTRRTAKRRAMRPTPEQRREVLPEAAGCRPTPKQVYRDLRALASALLELERRLVALLLIAPQLAVEPDA